MSTRYTKAEVEGIVKQLDVEAKMAGILPLDHGLVYNSGNIQNGISATVMVKGPDGNYVHGYDRFIPEFTYKTGRTEQARLLAAALNVFYVFRLQREEAARAARLETPEEAPDNATNNYRRYELDKVDASGEYPAKVKFFSDAGDSKHLNITATEFEQIKNVLLDYRND